jgi:hypothetical protein
MRIKISLQKLNVHQIKNALIFLFKLLNQAMIATFHKLYN